MKKRQCLVRGNKVYFYGSLARKVEQAIQLSGLTAKKWLDKAIKSHYQYLMRKQKDEKD